MRLLSLMAWMCLLVSLCARGATGDIAPKTPAGALDGAFVLTEQSPTMDWWAKVPANTGAQVNPVKKVYPGQVFFLIPFVTGYGLTNDHQFDLSYSLVKVGPDAAREQILTDLPLKGKSPDASVLQAPINFTGGMFEAGDPYGTYRFTLQMKDALTGAVLEKESVVELSPWRRPQDGMFNAQQLQSGYLGYYGNPDPDWLWLSFLSDEVSLEESGSPQGFNMVTLSFYRHAFGQYSFLLPRLNEAFDKATPSQRLKIILLFALLDQPQMADDRLSQDERAYQKQMREWAPPSPYVSLDKPDAVEWLWGEFFATGNYRPLWRLCYGLALVNYAKEPDRVLQQKDDVSAADMEAFWKGKTFATLMRSALLYGSQSPLARQYLGYALENEPLPQDNRAILLMVLRKLWPTRYEGAGAGAGAPRGGRADDEGPR